MVSLAGLASPPYRSTVPAALTAEVVAAPCPPPGRGIHRLGVGDGERYALSSARRAPLASLEVAAFDGGWWGARR